MIEAEERQSIINEAVEKALLSLPEIVNGLLAEKQVMREMSVKYFGDHPEFKEHKSVVASVIQQVETDNPGLSYTEILDKSTPIIKEMIRQAGSVDTGSIEKPIVHDYKKGETNNGML